MATVPCVHGLEYEMRRLLRSGSGTGRASFGASFRKPPSRRASRARSRVREIERRVDAAARWSVIVAVRTAPDTESSTLTAPVSSPGFLPVDDLSIPAAASGFRCRYGRRVTDPSGVEGLGRAGETGSSSSFRPTSPLARCRQRSTRHQHHRHRGTVGPVSRSVAHSSAITPLDLPGTPRVLPPRLDDRCRPTCTRRTTRQARAGDRTWIRCGPSPVELGPGEPAAKKPAARPRSRSRHRDPDRPRSGGDNQVAAIRGGGRSRALESSAANGTPAPGSSIIVSHCGECARGVDHLLQGFGHRPRPQRRVAEVGSNPAAPGRAVAASATSAMTYGLALSLAQIAAGFPCRAAGSPNTPSAASSQSKASRRRGVHAPAVGGRHGGVGAGQQCTEGATASSIVLPAARLSARPVVAQA